MDEAVAEIERRGYAILPDVIEPALVDALTEELARIEQESEVVPNDNSFEGGHTVRIYNLLARSEAFRAVPVHPDVLPVVERVLDPGCLVSSLSSIAIDPGETAQPIHADDQLLPLPKPHPATVCNTMWALTDFTEENGATRVIDGSHLWDHSPDYGAEYESRPAEMARGSVLVWHGSLWHGGGANTSTGRRIGVAMNYCAGWIRQQENQQLGVPVETVRDFEPRLRELVGYGIYGGLIGHIDKAAPGDVILGDGAGDGLLWDGA